MIDQPTASFLNGLTVATAAMFCVVVLWRSLNEERKQHIQDLRDFINRDVGDLKVRVLMIEDKLGMPRINHSFAVTNEFDGAPHKKPVQAEKVP